MDLFNLLLLVGAILGTAALFLEFHLHGWPQLIIGVICTFTVVYLGGAFFGQAVAPPWAIIAGKILIIGGVFALCAHIAHAVRHGGGGHGAGGHGGGGWGGVKATLVYVVGICLVAAVVAYDPVVGFHVPAIPSRPSITLPTPPTGPTMTQTVTGGTTTSITTSPTGAPIGTVIGVPVTPTPAAPAAKALPAGTKAGPLGTPPVECDGLSFSERQKRGC